ncbi:MAG: hypothetical protein HYX21_01595 [Candidatus Yanofskybacteria bacterium]|nr:hypothetical protein [Candidatus Yanofskybacteria bacterium]
MKNEVSIAEMKGPLGELYDQCSGENGRARFDEFKLWLKGVVSTLLAHVITVRVPAIKRFVASEVLGRTGTNRDGIRVAFLGKNFQEQFGGIVEENIPEAELTVSRLQRQADALEIAGAIPRERRVVKTGQIYQLVRIHEAGGHSGLLINGWGNFFLSYGVNGNLWLVLVLRSGFGWSFNADPLGHPRRWCGDFQVFFRKCF